MKLTPLLAALAVVLTEAGFFLFGLSDPSRILRRLPFLALSYTYVFSAFLILALTVLRLKWKHMTPLASALAGTISGLVLGPLAFAIAQMMDPVEQQRLLNGLHHFSIVQNLTTYFLFGIGVTLSWLHGGLAGFFAALLETGTQKLLQFTASDRESRLTSTEL